jgi:hypothetical protein
LIPVLFIDFDKNFVLTRIKDPDQHSFSKLDMDPHSPKKLDPEPQKVNADPKHRWPDTGYRYKKGRIAGVP